MKDITELIAGFARFRGRYFSENDSIYERLTKNGQTPKVMVIGCCDSRVDPAIVFDCDPGDLFVVRNVANLVPPCEADGHYHGTSAALEFAVRGIKVEHVVVMGHARCGGIQALLGQFSFGADTGQFLGPWMSIAAQAREQATARFGNQPPEVLRRACEFASIRISLKNLMSFPFVDAAVKAGQIAVHGWYFDLESGELWGCNTDRGEFIQLAGATMDALPPVAGSQPTTG